jgi:hypothetical protein
MSITKTIVARFALAAMVAALGFSCSEINRQSSPVKLQLTTTEQLHQVDLLGGSGCNRALGTVNIQAILIQQNATNTTFDNVKLDRYQISYVRTDGGTQIPQPFTRAMSTTLTVGATAQALTDFLAFPPDALNQAPFAALQPQNGGRDPQTGRKFVSMDIVLDVFGQTLAGERVSGSTRIPLDFCYDCGGCS